MKLKGGKKVEGQQKKNVAGDTFTHEIGFVTPQKKYQGEDQNDDKKFNPVHVVNYNEWFFNDIF